MAPSTSGPVRPKMKTIAVPEDPIAAASEVFAAKKWSWTGQDKRVSLSLEPRERINEWLEHTRAIYNDRALPQYAFSPEVEAGMHIVSLRPARDADTKGKPLIDQIVFGLTVPFSMINAYGTLNGGFAGVLMDRCSALMLVGAAKEGFWEFGAVSTAISVYWHNPIYVGEKIEVEAQIETINKSICTMTVRIRRAEDKAICITGQHAMKALRKSVGGDSKSKL